MKASKLTATPDRVAFNIIGYAIIAIFGLLCIIPFYIIIVASFTPEATILKQGYAMFFRTFTVKAYQTCFKDPMQIYWAYRNTIVVTIVGTFLAVNICCMTGYVLQRKDFYWRNQFSFFFFFTTLFNGGLTPWYIMCMKMGFKNNMIALVIPLLFSVWYMIIAKSFMKSIPYEITESAKIDGASDWIVYFRIVLPLAKPLVATLTLFSAMAYWNDWFNCMLFISDNNKMDLQYFLQQMINSAQALQLIASKGGSIGDGSTQPLETMKMAMTIITIGPIVLLYPFIQKYFVKGLTIGAVKG